MIVASFILLTAFSAGANISFDVVSLKIDGKPVKARVADDDPKRSQGLMHIPNLGADEGMLFVFEQEQILSFWMKNTLIPLSIGFFNGKGELVDVKEMKPAESIVVAHPPNYQSSVPASFALEMNQRWFEKNGIKTGAKLELTSSTKSELLRRKLKSARPSSR